MKVSVLPAPSWIGVFAGISVIALKGGMEFPVIAITMPGGSSLQLGVAVANPATSSVGNKNFRTKSRLVMRQGRAEHSRISGAKGCAPNLI